ncbi:hypothetical protein C8Q78DRAFT_1076957 [Trametes maxima]|nr:hypothetical protein C8Q78DRAFT_1076957 [Trametes maxima]
MQGGLNCNFGYSWHTSRRIPLPVELLEVIVTESWKTSASFDELRQLYKTLTKAHSVFRHIVVRVALRFIVIPGLEILDYPEHDETTNDRPTFHRLLTTLAEQKLALSGHGTARRANSEARTSTHAMTPPFWNAHLHLQGGYHWEFISEVLFGTKYFDLWRLLLGRVRSFTFSPLPGERPAASSMHDFEIWDTHDFLSVLQIATRLTHLHLDYDRCDSFRGRDDARQHVVLPSVTFVRTRSYLCCGAASLSAHAPECRRARVAETFPGLRELQLDAPLFLKYFATPRGLEVGYNVGAGLKNGFLSAPRARARAGGASDDAAWARRTVVVRVGAEAEPLGWSQAETACLQFGVRLVKDVVFYRANEKRSSTTSPDGSLQD